MPTRTVDVLLVEDDQAIRDTLCEVLQDEGYRVATANHGAQALERLQDGLRPQLILLDLMMPVMDGWQMLQHLHRHPHLARIPVVVVSAARDAVPAGARSYLHKPVDIDTLLHAIAAQCGAAAATADAPMPRPHAAAEAAAR